jgi:acyl carrier protein
MEKLFELIEDIFEIEKDDYSENTVINQIETWDSLKHMEFIISLEDQFSINLTGNEIAELRTIKDVIKLILINNEKI